MANFVFKKTEQTAMKIAGFVDVEKMTIEVDGDYKDLKTLLSPFEGACIEINVKVKTETELDEPTKADAE